MSRPKFLQAFAPRICDAKYAHLQMVQIKIVRTHGAEFALDAREKRNQFAPPPQLYIVMPS